jgi:membrane protease YdiL (CAAX protease family)
MKSRSLILIFFVLTVLAVLFSLVNYSSLTPSRNTEGARAAYFTKVKHPATAYEGKNFTCSLTIYNKNCTTDGEDNAYFYFMFYLDGDLWWSEYNNTDYQIWQCNRASSVTRGYIVSSWHTTKPVVHDLKIELYWYDGNASRVEDFVSFSVSVAVHVEPANLMIYSYVFVYLMSIFLLGFYILVVGPVEISQPPPKNATFVFRGQSVRMVGFLPKVCRHLFLCFYLFVFASWQIINALFFTFSLPEQLLPSVQLIVQITYIIVLVLLIGKKNSSFKGYDYLWPEEASKYVAVSLLLAVWYNFATIFIPGLFSGYDIFPSLSSTEVFLAILLALVASFTSETIFRGYIQSKLTELSGFPLALLATSIMFTLYTLPLLPFDLSRFFFEVLSFFVLGIFLGILFYRTKTLLCPIIFYFAVSILKPLTAVKPLTSEFSELFLEFIALAISLLLLSVLTVKKKQETSDDQDMLARAL